VTSPHPTDRHVSPSCRPSPLPVLLTLISPVLLTVTSSHPADRRISPFEGGWGDVNCQTVTSPRSADRHFSPFEGSPRAGAAEYVQRGDVTNRQIAKSPN